MEALLVLNAVNGLGNVGIKNLMARYGSAAEVLSLSESDLLQEAIVAPKIIQNILNFPKDKFLKCEYNLITQKQIRVISCWEDGYPKNLFETVDCPVVLYIKGKLPQDDNLALGIVGSRKASFYGQTIAEQFATRLAELGITIVSGMARGIDTAAHKGTLKAKGTTIAVLGCGLNHIYPPENKKLFDEISQTGAVISEFSMTMEPFAFNFPRRNRIISGLSMGVIVVEAAARSGALITADCALEQGREVYAVPGKIDNPSAQGVNNLIKQGAKLVMSIEDILEDLKPQLDIYIEKKPLVDEVSRVTEDINQTFNLTAMEKQILDSLSDRPIHIDELMNSSEGVGSSMSSVLLRLEMKKLVKQMPGKMFIRS